MPSDDPLADMGYNEYLISEDAALGRGGHEVNIGATISRITANVDYTGMDSEEDEASSFSSSN